MLFGSGNKSKVEIIGVYPVRVTQDSINEAIKYHMFDWMADEYGNYNLPIDWKAFENLVLVECQWSGKFSKENLKRFVHIFEVPYMSFYLSADGTKLLDEDDAMVASDRRVCFFLHDFDISQPIVWGKIKFQVDALSDLLLRLQPFTHYVPDEGACEDEETLP